MWMCIGDERSVVGQQCLTLDYGMGGPRNCEGVAKLWSSEANGREDVVWVSQGELVLSVVAVV